MKIIVIQNMVESVRQEPLPEMRKLLSDYESLFEKESRIPRRSTLTVSPHDLRSARRARINVWGGQ
jgi:hypothetical protein